MFQFIDYMFILPLRKYVNEDLIKRVSDTCKRVICLQINARLFPINLFGRKRGANYLFGMATYGNLCA